MLNIHIKIGSKKIKKAFYRIPSRSDNYRNPLLRFQRYMISQFLRFPFFKTLNEYIINNDFHAYFYILVCD
jgi:hypothetical protein